MRNEKETDDLLNKLSKKSHTPKDAFGPSITWSKLEQQLTPQRSKHVNLRIVWRSIAAIIVFVLAGFTAYEMIYMEGSEKIYANAEIKNIILPDGTEVILNRNSSLEYPRRFHKNLRNVKMEGEALFQVTKNPKAPFIVNIEEVEIKVLGTRFNIEAYPKDSLIETTLINGSVMMSTPKTGQMIILKPNEMLTYNKCSGELSSPQSVNALESIEWESGDYTFDYLPLKEITRILSNSFNTPIVIEDSKLADFKIRVNFTHKESLDNILEILSKTANFEYTKTTERIILTTLSK